MNSYFTLLVVKCGHIFRLAHYSATELVADGTTILLSILPFLNLFQVPIGVLLVHSIVSINSAFVENSQVVEDDSTAKVLSHCHLISIELVSTQLIK